MGGRYLGLAWRLAIVLVLLSVALVPLALAQEKPREEVNASHLLVPPNDRFGLNRASFGADVPSGYEHQLGPEAGAAWNRWPLYWYLVESDKGFDYSNYDRAVAGDVLRGTKLDLVLMGTPATYAASRSTATPAAPNQHREEREFGVLAGAQDASSVHGSTPRDLDLPIFADGTDNYAPHKPVNPNNYWARFVAQTVERYKPGGQLAREQSWPAGAGVRHWEIWNEPDVLFYWYARGAQTEVHDYARLLKVAYLVAKAADPDCIVVIGGLSFWGRETWLQELLGLLAAEPQAPDHGHFFDVVAWHVYSRPADLYSRATNTRQILAERSLSGKQVWINEANVPVWGDPTPSQREPGSHRATPDEQAAFVLQSYAYAFAGGADKVFTFMLYDDCWGFGEHYGLVRNPPGEYDIGDCASDGQPRPGYRAFKVAASYLRGIKAGRLFSAGPNGDASLAQFDTDSGRRVTVAWNKRDVPLTVDIPLRGQALLIDHNGGTALVSPNVNGVYSLYLSPATANDAAEGEPPAFIIGGRTLLLVELTGTGSGGDLINGGFDMSPPLAAWLTDGAAPQLVPLARTGLYAALLKVEPEGKDYCELKQTLLVRGSGRYFSFAYATHTSQPQNGSVGGLSRFEVILRQGGEERVLLSESASREWTERRLDLTAYAGRLFTLSFRARGDKYPFAAYVDNAALWNHQLLVPFLPFQSQT
ncbi:MAG: hypothetical protein ACYC4L_21170 [Chloroflexota bacterium]